MIRSLPNSRTYTLGFKLYILLYFTFLFAPLLVTCILAFNDSQFPSLPWKGFTIEWFTGNLPERVGIFHDDINLYSIWVQASNNLLGLLSKYNGQYSEQVKDFVGWLLKTLTSIGLTFLQFIVSIIIAGALLAKADMGAETAKEFAKRLVGDNAENFINLITGTIRSVVQGILGIALLQAFASAILLIIFNVPMPGLWALFVLILATVQLSPLLIMGPISIYVFSVLDTTPAIVFTVSAVLIGSIDNLLKPLLLGRGVDIPMLVILLGAIGGMLAFGILGLFVGAVVLAVSYKLMMAWLHGDKPAF